MTVAGCIDAPLDQFGGLMTDMQPSDLSLGVSPYCADVAFLIGAKPPATASTTPGRTRF